MVSLVVPSMVLADPSLSVLCTAKAAFAHEFIEELPAGYGTVLGAGDCNGTSLGVSQFHTSCLDQNMNSIEDCGRNLGDGKNDDPGLINDWLLEGMVGDETLDCTPSGVAPPPPPDCGLGPVLALILPGLMLMHRRRLRQR